MTALFTDAAIERMEHLAQRPDEKAELAQLLTAVDAAASPADLFKIFPGTVQLAKTRQADLLVVKSGDMHAVVSIDPDHPGVMVVATVYRGDEAKPEDGVVQPAQALT